MRILVSRKGTSLAPNTNLRGAPHNNMDIVVVLDDTYTSETQLQNSNMQFKSETEGF